MIYPESAMCVIQAAECDNTIEYKYDGGDGVTWDTIELETHLTIYSPSVRLTEWIIVWFNEQHIKEHFNCICQLAELIPSEPHFHFLFVLN